MPHKPAREPKEIGSQEELYLEGLHLEQYRHVTLRAQDYYMEALHRDPGDSRCNNAMGLLMMRRGNCRGGPALHGTGGETLYAAQSQSEGRGILF